MSNNTDIPERDQISRRLVAMTTEQMRLKDRMLELAQRDYDLVPNVTRVRQDGIVGTFMTVLNYDEPGPPWIRVMIDPKAPPREQIKHFYGIWEKVSLDEL